METAQPFRGQETSNSVERGQKLIRPEFVHKIWAKTNQQSVCKRNYSTNQKPGICDNSAQHELSLCSSIMSLPAKFQLNPISGLFATPLAGDALKTS